MSYGSAHPDPDRHADGGSRAASLRRAGNRRRAGGPRRGPRLRSRPSCRAGPPPARRGDGAGRSANPSRRGQRPVAEHAVHARRGDGRPLPRIVFEFNRQRSRSRRRQMDAEFRQHVAKAIELAEARVARPAARSAGPLRPRAPPSASRRRTSRRSKGRCSPAFEPRAAPTTSTSRCWPWHPARKDAGLIVGTYRYRRLHALAADADDGLRRGLRRRTGARHPG